MKEEHELISNEIGNDVPISIDEDETKRLSAASSISSLPVDLTSEFSEKNHFSYKRP